MRRCLVAPLLVIVSVLTACSTGDSAQNGTVPQPSDEIDQSVVDDSAAEEMSNQCRSGLGVLDRPVRVVTSVSPLTSLAALLVAGTDVKVTGLVPEGTNSHTFEPPPSAAKSIEEADVVIVNGLGLEDPIIQLAEANMNDDAVLCEVGTAAVAKSSWIFDDSFPQDAGKPNPHAWTNPSLVLRYLNAMRDALSTRAVDHIRAIDDNYVKLSALVMELDQAMTAATETVPVRNRKLLTYHDSFPYTARSYGYEIIGAIQPQSFSEPTPADVAALIEQVKDEKVPAVFGSEVFPSPVLEQIGKEAGVRYVDTLRDDDLPGGAGEPEHSWAGLIKFDFVTIVEALGGDASALKAVSVDIGIKDKAYYPQ